MDLNDIRAILRALHENEVEYVLVGGVAVGLHGLERPTADIDLFVRAEDENIDRLKRALRSLWNDSAIEEIRAADLRGAYPVIRYGPPEGNFYIDIMSRVGTELTYDALEFQALDLGGIPVRLATPATLHRMKHKTRRAIDQIDAVKLKEKFNLEG